MASANQNTACLLGCGDAVRMPSRRAGVRNGGARPFWRTRCCADARSWGNPGLQK